MGDKERQETVVHTLSGGKSVEVYESANTASEGTRGRAQREGKSVEAPPQASLRATHNILISHIRETIGR